MAGFLLSEQDRNLLRSLLDRERREIQNTVGRPAVVQHPGYAPEVYVARTPVGGIPGMTEETGTGFNDHPGYADCDIYRIVGTGLAATLHPITGLFRTVYNLSTTAVEGSKWVQVQRDKFGHWLVPEPNVSTVIGCQVTVDGGTVAPTTSNYRIVDWDSETNDTWDTGGFHDNGVNPSRLTASFAGTYRLHYWVRWTAFANVPDTYTETRVMKNGADIFNHFLMNNSSASWIDVPQANGIRDIHLNTGDYLEMRLWHNAGSTIYSVAALFGLELKQRD